MRKNIWREYQTSLYLGVFWVIHNKMLIISWGKPFLFKRSGQVIDRHHWVMIPRSFVLVGGFNPFEKYARQNGFIFPKFRGENSKNI